VARWTERGGEPLAGMPSLALVAGRVVLVDQLFLPPPAGVLPAPDNLVGKVQGVSIDARAPGLQMLG